MKTPDDARLRLPNRPSRRGPLRALLDLFSSVWLGVFTLTALLIYMSVGSALPPVRQLRAFELTEFEWFHWWPFDVMIALLCVNLVVATLRRIPLRVVNLGVWMIHSGIIILALGSVYYFTTKVEGDAPVVRRELVIRAPGHEAVSIPALPGASAQVGDYEIRVASIDPAWELRSGEDAGTRAYSVMASVRTPERAFVRQLLAGYPQYTEDVLPGQGRAIKAIGEAIVDPDLQLSLDYHPQEWMYLINSRALYARPSGTTEWRERGIPGLPRYNDYVASPEHVWVAPGDTLRPDPIDIPIRPFDGLEGVDVRVTGYLRYAFADTRLARGGDGLNPAVHVQLQNRAGAVQEYQLIAFDPALRATADGLVAMRWVESDAEFEALADRNGRRLTARATESGEEVSGPVGPSLAEDADLAFTPIGGSGYSYRVRFTADALPLPTGGTVSTAGVEVRAPDGRTFVRWVTDNPALTRDMPADESGGEAPLEMDPGVEFVYDPGDVPARLTIVGGPTADSPLRLLVFTGVGAPAEQPLTVGAPARVAEDLWLTVRGFLADAREESRPQVVPRRERDPQATDLFAMLRITVSAGGKTQSAWLPFNSYALPDENYAYPGRFRYEPVSMTLADGREIEFMFSRERVRLPHPIALEDFHVRSHVGGYTGETTSIRDWISDLRFETENGWSEPMAMRTNGPVRFGDLWHFQKTWDRPERPRFQGDAGSAGLNFTGVGIGNRNGVWIQLFGCCVAVAGMVYAFYVKPVIKRRRAERVRAELASGARAPREHLEAARSLETAEAGAS